MEGTKAVVKLPYQFRRCRRSGWKMWSERGREWKLGKGPSYFKRHLARTTSRPHTDMSLRDLRSALQSLSDQSLKDSRRLDDTYYFILEKVSVLRQTISSLQELSSLTKELRDNFGSGAEELIDDIKGHVESSDNFGVQQKQIATLEERLKAGKEKADALTARLAEAKERVDARAKTEAQWAARGKRTSLPASVIDEVINVACRTSTNILGHPWLFRRYHLDTGSFSPAQTNPC
jgi:hypothetical protein